MDPGSAANASMSDLNPNQIRPNARVVVTEFPNGVIERVAVGFSRGGRPPSESSRIFESVSRMARNGAFRPNQPHDIYVTVDPTATTPSITFCSAAVGTTAAQTATSATTTTRSAMPIASAGTSSAPTTSASTSATSAEAAGVSKKRVGYNDNVQPSKKTNATPTIASFLLTVDDAGASTDATTTTTTATATTAPLMSSSDAPFTTTVATLGTGAASASTSMIPTVSFTAKQKEDFLKLLECPVCFEIAKKPPLKSCEKGHITCAYCFKKMIPTRPLDPPECGVCRAPITGRNTFAENIMDFVLQTTTLDCRNKSVGCSFSNFGVALTKHEEHECPFREVSCPASFRRRCHKKALFKDIEEHMTSTNCCMYRYPTRDNQNWEVWSVILGNHHHTPAELYQAQNMNVWNPIILVSKYFKKYLPYLVALRTLSGSWYFFVKSYAAREVVNSIPLRIIVKTAGRSGPAVIDKHNFFVYHGNMSQHLDDNTNEVAIMETGRYLMMRDEQVKKLSWNNEQMLEIIVQLGKHADAGHPVRLLEN